MKRILSIILIMILLTALGSNVAFAIDSKNSSLKVIMKWNNEPLYGVKVTTCMVAGASLEKNEIIYKTTPSFDDAGVTFSDLSIEKNLAIASSLDAYAHANNIERNTKITDISGTVFFNDLAAGIYLISQDDEENSEFIINPYLISIPSYNDAKNEWDYDVITYPKTEPNKQIDALTSISVHKVWEGAGEIPSSISVQLYKNDNPHGDPVSLDSSNYWSHTWMELPLNETWTVDELDVPDGYIKSIAGNSSEGFIITNTKAKHLGDDTNDSNPIGIQTGDNSSLQLWIILIAISLSCISIIAFIRVIDSLHKKDNR